MTDVVVAYIPVLHDGYRRFLEAHGAGKPLFVVGEDLYAHHGPLAKDIRALDPALVAAAIGAWGVCSSAEVLTKELAVELGESGRSITLPAEDVSYQLVDTWFPRSPVWFDSVFLRWDKTRTVQLLAPRPDRRVAGAGRTDAGRAGTDADLRALAEEVASSSVDWWRQVGAAMRLVSGEVRVAANEHQPDPLSAYAVGDPRSNFHQGVHLELTTAMHAEARLIAGAARDGASVVGASLYVTDFPCPPCAKLIAASGVARLWFRTGYAVLDGEDVLRAAGVEVVQVVDDEPGPADAPTEG